MAKSGDRLIGLVEVAHDLQHPCIQPQIPRRAPTGNHQSVVGRGLDRVEVRVQNEVMPALLCVGLVAFKVMDRRANLLALLLAGADRIDGVAHHLRA